jgi:hypothetical protein
LAAAALAEVGVAGAAVETTAEQQAVFEHAQEVTGLKWGAYLVAWGAWLAFDLYRQNSKKAEEEAAAAAAAAAAADEAPSPGSGGSPGPGPQ